MSYADKAGMIEAFGEREVLALTDRNDLCVIDDVLLDKALAKASAEINTYLESRYSLPLASVPEILVTYTCDIARYRLCGSDVTVTDEIRNRYKDAVSFLTKVSTGVIRLGLDAGGNATPQTAGPETSADDGVFTPDRLGSYL